MLPIEASIIEINQIDSQVVVVEEVVELLPDSHRQRRAFELLQHSWLEARSVSWLLIERVGV